VQPQPWMRRAAPGQYTGRRRPACWARTARGSCPWLRTTAVSVPHVAALNVADVFTIVAIHRRSVTSTTNAYTFYSKGANSINFGISTDKIRLRQNSVGDCLLASTSAPMDLHKEHMFVARKNGATERRSGWTGRRSPP
jgi:hypothetical protein